MTQPRTTEDQVEPEWMTPAEVAEMMRVSMATLARYRTGGRLKATYLTDRSIRYRRSDVVAFMLAGAEQ